MNETMCVVLCNIGNEQHVDWVGVREYDQFFDRESELCMK